VAEEARLVEEEKMRAVARAVEEEKQALARFQCPPAAPPADVVFVVDNSGSMASGVAFAGGCWPFAAHLSRVRHGGSSRSDRARDCVLQMTTGYLRAEVGFRVVVQRRRGCYFARYLVQDGGRRARHFH
jgi:hypothetical protein